jgi:REP element-mobilizing transposase RayT
MQQPRPLAYFLTFTTHGTWLHGDERGSVDRDHNIFGTKLAAANLIREAKNRESMKGTEVVLSSEARAVVDEAIRKTCIVRLWTLHALNVRSNHVHVVVTSDDDAEKTMNDLKAWATRALREGDLVKPDQRVWTRKGSRHKLFTTNAVAAAAHYTLHEQDGPKA